ncbi:hypothetical protein V6N12_053849 [Hibiscus sabdariffa]|uniref:Uncharacterized protein n=1 Tax=Hibiscus sabdariffa TaxID=183260 RepID=A0ABR2DAH1_9ROSI
MFSVKKITNSNWAELSSGDKVGRVILREQTSSLEAKYLAQAPCFIHGSTTSEIVGSWSHGSTHGRRLLSSSSNGGDLGTIIWPRRGTTTISRGRMMQTSSKVLRIGDGSGSVNPLTVGDFRGLFLISGSFTALAFLLFFASLLYKNFSIMRRWGRPEIVKHLLGELSGRGGVRAEDGGEVGLIVDVPARKTPESSDCWNHE